jgi:hypothetical protein
MQDGCCTGYGAYGIVRFFISGHLGREFLKLRIILWLAFAHDTPFEAS